MRYVGSCMQQVMKDPSRIDAESEPKNMWQTNITVMRKWSHEGSQHVPEWEPTCIADLGPGFESDF